MLLSVTLQPFYHPQALGPFIYINGIDGQSAAGDPGVFDRH